jgi:LacI family transcriptional regulator, galactose operon repressor
MTVTMEQVAKHAGVSLKTVSRVLNDERGVSKTTQEIVRQSIEVLGFVANASARRLARGQARSLDLILPYTDHSYATMLLESVLQQSQARNFSVMVQLQSPQERSHLSSIQMYKANQIDGVILGSDAQYNRALIDEIRKNHIPHVLIQPDPDTIDLSSEEFVIKLTDREGAFEAVEYLLKLGHQRIGYISSGLGFAHEKERFRGYKDALLANGLEIDSRLIFDGEGQFRDGFTGAQRLLELKTRPTAIFVSTDQSAFGALNYVLQSGLRVPSDISIIGFDDVPWSSQFTPALTTVHQPIQDIGKIAADLLIDYLLTKKFKERVVLVKTSLIVRQSCSQFLAP